MDVKNKYPPSPPKGTSAADSKKNQDVCPKALRKREATGANNFPRNEHPKKYNIQKNTVKRPRAKGQYHGGTEENTKVVEAKRAEPGSVLVHKNKKENGNHLLNFHYELTDAQSRNAGKATKKFSRNSNRSLPPVQRHKYNKEHFLQASCQFIVTANEDYSLYLNNPDVLVDWKLIEQIRVCSSENIICPICLYSPVAGKITRCGHIYCWSCILRNIDVNGINAIWCKCPICYDSVNKNDLKSVVEITQNTFNLGDILTLRLMRREKDSVFGIPIGSETRAPTTFLSISENSTNEIYSKLLIANVEDIMDIVEMERKQLKHELKDDANNCYIEQALNELSQRENNLLLEITKAEDVLSTENETVEEIIKHVTQDDEVNTDSICKNDAKSPTECSPKTANNASNKSQSTSGTSKFIYYYQAKDGQHLFLHAVNVKMLEMQYGSLEKCPFEITGRLLEKEAGSCTEDLRQRLRYLRHLPLACPFEIAEIELKPPLVSTNVLHFFNDQLNLRQKHRKRRESEERKRERNIQKEQNERMGKYPTLDLNIESRQDFPEWKPELLFEEHPPLSPEPTTTSDIASSSFSSTSDGIAAETDYSHEQQQQVPSFAEMLRNKRTRAKPIDIQPPITKSVQSKTYANTMRTRSPSYQNNSRQQPNEDEDIEEAYYTSPPSNNQCFGDALSRALEQSKLLDMGSNGNDAIRKKTKKPKKRGKETVLFATTMSRGS